MRNFNLTEAQKGAKLVTRTGCVAKFLCVDRINNKVLVNIISRIDRPYTIKVNMDGRRYKGTEHFEDIFIAA